MSRVFFTNAVNIGNDNQAKVRGSVSLVANVGDVEQHRFQG